MTQKSARKDNGTTIEDTASRLVQRFRDIVDSKPRAGLPIGHYAAVLGISESRLTSHCRRIAGVSPLQVINACLIRTAKERMCETTLSTSAIAFSLGFRDPAYFSRFFRLQTGQTPTEYRTAARAEAGAAARLQVIAYADRR